MKNQKKKVSKTKVMKIEHDPERENLVRFYDISWDTDGVKTNLPKIVEMGVSKEMSEEDLQNDGADELSNRFGYCVNEFYFEFVKK